jgi:hypothetical protein
LQFTQPNIAIMTKSQLDATDHDRDSAGMTYVYPVVSRRAQGVSIGINLNPNNACNWRCVYCQVPNLTRGAAPEIDLAQLERELRTMLEDAINCNAFPKILAAWKTSPSPATANPPAPPNSVRRLR